MPTYRSTIRVAIAVVALACFSTAGCDADGRDEESTPGTRDPGTAATPPAPAAEPTRDETPSAATPEHAAAIAALRAQAGALLHTDAAADKAAFEATHPPPLRAAMFRAALASLAFEAAPTTPDGRAERALEFARAYALAAPPRLARPVASGLAAWALQLDGVNVDAFRTRFGALTHGLAEWAPAVRASGAPGAVVPGAGAAVPGELSLDPPFRIDPSKLRRPADAPVDDVAVDDAAGATSPPGPGSAAPVPAARGAATGPTMMNPAARAGSGVPNADALPSARSAAPGRPRSDGRPGAADRSAAPIGAAWSEAAVRVEMAGAADAVAMPERMHVVTEGAPPLTVPLTWPTVRMGEPGARRVPVWAEVLVPTVLPAAGEPLRLTTLTVTLPWTAMESATADTPSPAVPNLLPSDADADPANERAGSEPAAVETEAVPRPMRAMAEMGDVAVHMELARALCGLETSDGDALVLDAGLGGLDVVAGHAFVPPSRDRGNTQPGTQPGNPRAGESLGGSHAGSSGCRVVTLALDDGRRITIVGKGMATDVFVGHASTLLASVEAAP